MSIRDSETATAAGLDPRGYRGLVEAGGYLAVCAVVLNLLLELLFGRLQSPDKWYQLDRNLLDMVGGKSQMVAEGYTARPSPLIALLGPSAIRLGVDSELARELSGVPWLNLGVLGASVVTTRNHLTPFLRSGLKPDLVFFGVCSCWLGRDARHRENAETYNPQGWTWLSRNRKPLADEFSRLLLLARARYGISRWPDEIWQTRQKFFRTVTPDFLAWQLQQVTKRGYFNPAGYAQPVNDEVDAVSDTLAQLKLLGLKRVVLVDMPVHSQIRKRTPPAAAELLAGLARRAGMPELEVVDLTSALPDSSFVDYFHPNLEGERALTAALARLAQTSP